MCGYICSSIKQHNQSYPTQPTLSDTLGTIIPPLLPLIICFCPALFTCKSKVLRNVVPRSSPPQASKYCADAKDYLEMMCHDLSAELAQFDLQKEKEFKQMLLDYAAAQLEKHEKVSSASMVASCPRRLQLFCSGLEPGNEAIFCS